MSFPVPVVLPYSFQSELGSTFGTHLDANFVNLADTLNATLTQLELIQRDDGDIRNQTVSADAFASDALALMAGSSVSSSLDWRPRGNWLTATLYQVGNIVQTGTPAVSYVCSVQHVSGVFATDNIAGRWVVLSSPRTLISADVTGALGFTPVNKAGDTMTGALVAPTSTSISGVTFTDTLLAQDLVTINKGLYSAYESTAADNVFGFAANVVRAGGSGFVVGAQCSGISTVTAGTVFGGNFNAIGLSGCQSPLIGIEIDAGSYDPGNALPKQGLYLLFANRAGVNAGEYNYVLPSGTYSNAGAGLGANLYNYNAWAINVDSQTRSPSGEWCGWNRGITFSEYSMDSMVDAAYPGSRAYPICVDFSALHYYGGTNPVTAFNLEAAIALRDLQTIWWNRDPATAATSTSKVKTYFNPAVGRFVLANGGTERFGIDVLTGNLYQNGALVVVPSLASNNTWTGTNTYNSTVTLATNLVFTGNARRITGDFSNATVANRTLVQTTSANSATELGILPNGTGGVSALYVLSDSAANNCRVGRISIDATQFQIAAGVVGASTYIPMTFGVSGVERLRIDAATGQVIVNSTVVTNIACKFRVNGIIQCDNAVGFSVHRNGTNFVIADNTPTVIDFTTEVFDENLSYDIATEKYAPPLGKYVLMGSALCAVSVDQGAIVVSVYKNGVAHKSGNVATMSGIGSTGSQVHCIVEANGTDYFQLVVTQVTGAPATISGLATDTWFQGYRIG